MCAVGLYAWVSDNIRGEKSEYFMMGEAISQVDFINYAALGTYSFETCETPPSVSYKSSSLNDCAGDWVKMGVGFPEDFGSSECRVHHPNYTLDYRESISDVPGSTFDELAEQLPCEPEFIGDVTLYTFDAREEERWLNDVTIYEGRSIVSDYEVYGISAGDDARYVVFMKTDGDLILQSFMGKNIGLDAWRAEGGHVSAKATIHSDDNRWAKAAIALGRSRASGCGAFDLHVDLTVTCLDGGRWAIDLDKLSAEAI
jgi:hypothetical protein